MGIAFFGDYPDAGGLIGSAIIVLSSLFIFHCQRVVDKAETDTALTRVH